MLTRGNGDNHLELLTVLQARMSSKRFPGKVIADLNGAPMILRQINRITKAQHIEKLVVATSTDQSDDILADLLVSEGVEVFRGELGNVFSRFYELNQLHQPKNIMRLTADCPLVMPDLIDEIIQYFNKNSFDYVSNTLVRMYPDGLDIEIFRAQILEELFLKNLTSEEMEHVTLGIHSRPEEFHCQNFSNVTSKVSGRWTVDYPEDLKIIRKIYSKFIGREESFTFNEARLAAVELGLYPRQTSIKNQNQSKEDL